MRYASIRALAALLVAPFFALTALASRATDAQDAPIVMVCEHGSVKSLIAAELFNREAKARGLPFRAIARGVTPDTAVPNEIAEALAREGLDVRGFKPTALSKSDATNASRIIAIGVDLPAVAAHASATIQRWDDVPAATVDYPAAHASLEQHINELLNRLKE